MTLGLPLALLLSLQAEPADESPSPHPGLYLSPGIILAGAATLEDEGGFFGGGELSLNYYTGTMSFGGYVDAGYSFATERTRVGLGPQWAYGPFGLDAAYVASFGTEGVRHGLQYSGWFGVGFAVLYVRHCVLFDARDEIEAGLMLKIPFPLTEEPPSEADTAETPADDPTAAPSTIGFEGDVYDADDEDSP